MPTQIFHSRDSDTVLCIHEPGNATRYVGVACRPPETSPVYSAERQWVVAFPEIGASYIFAENRNIHWGYVSEKLGMQRTGRLLDKADVSEMTKMVAMMVPGCTANAITDETGHLVESENYA